jgi:serine/threonine protein kinase
MHDRDTLPTARRMLPDGLRILDLVGSTPEGTLYHAEYLDGREVALLLGSLESHEVNASRRNLLERAIRIQHVNVAGTYEVGGLEDGSLYVVLEKVSGEPLSKLLTAGHEFSLPEALDIALQVAAGLRAAHREGFVHGSLSPETILVSEAHGRAQIKLVGFQLDPSLGESGNALPLRKGAGAYASPERLAGHPPNDRADVFSLGAVLHHLLSGRPPDSGEVDGSLPAVTRDVLVTALAPAPARRYSISEFYEVLERLTEVAAERTGPVSRRVLALGVVGAAAVVVLGAGVSLLTRAELPGSREVRPTTTRVESPEPPATQPPKVSAPATAPAQSPPPANSTSRRDTLHVRSNPVARPAREARVPRPETDSAESLVGDGYRPTATDTVGTDTIGTDTTGTDTVSTPPPEPRTIEDRAQIYLRIGLDEARRQLGRPVHAIEGMSPLFHGLAMGVGSPFTDSRPVVRSVYLGPNESLILLDQQRVRPGDKVPQGGPGWRVGDIMLYLHGEVRPEVLGNLSRRVR